MADTLDPARDEQLTAAIKDKTSVGSTIGGFIALLIILVACPPLLLLAPFVIVGLVILFFVGQTNSHKARKLVRSHLRGQQSSFEMVQSTGNADAIALNDWGLVFVRAGRKPIHCAWHDIQKVHEAHLGVLHFYARHADFEIDFTQNRYFQIIEVLEKHIRDRLQLMIDPATGKSKFAEMLAAQPFEWKGRHGHFVISREGIRLDDKRLAWDEIDRVTELYRQIDEEEPDRKLVFEGRGVRMVLDNKMVDKDNLLPRYTDFDLVRAIAKERIPHKVSLYNEAPSPRERAFWEFQQMQEASEAAFSLALNSGKFDHVEAEFRKMRALVDKYSLHDEPAVKEFLEHDTLLQNRMAKKI